MPAKTRVEIQLENIRMMMELDRQHRMKEENETSLRSFVKSAWPVVEPGVPYVHGWYLDALCSHLEAVANGEIRKLIINISPRSAKSILCCVMFPAWVWITNPSRKWLFASYDLKLSLRDSRKCRALIGSAWYQRNWNESFKILSAKGGQDSKQRFDNDKGGHRVATATDAGTIGEGADILCMDDPNNVRDMVFDSYIESVIYFHEHVMSTRLNDPKTGCRVLIQQRCHEQDLTGHILSKETGWEHLVIPMEFEEKRPPTSIGWQDPRQTPGEIMCPERMSPSELRELKTSLGPQGVSGQLQQRPSPGEGARFKREWFNFYNEPGIIDERPIEIRVPGGEKISKVAKERPVAFEQLLHAWDMAFKGQEDSDLVSGHVWGRVGANVYLVDRDSRRMDFPETLAAVRAMSIRYPCPEKLVEGKANGPAVIQTLRNEIPGLIESPITEGVVPLATSLTGYAEAGNVYLPNPNQHPWVLELIEQFAVFPRGKHDDDVAAASHAWRRLFDAVSNTAVPEFRVLPRANEVDTACHVKDREKIAAECLPHWRRWIAVSPGKPGAALWFAETPRGSLRIYREMPLDAADAHEAGRRIAEQTLPEIRAYLAAIHQAARWSVSILLEKDAFTPVEPIGSYAELLEHGVMAFEPSMDSFDERQRIAQELKMARFSTEMAIIEDAAFDRLRDLLRFKPIDFAPVKYDRDRAIKLSRDDFDGYKRYMAAVDNRVEGEWPKIKFSSDCVGVIQAMGTVRRDEDIENPFMRALLIGISAPAALGALKQPKEIPWPPEPRLQTPRRGARLKARFG